MKVSYGLPAALMGVAASIAIVQPLTAFALPSTQVSQLAKQFTVLIDGANSGSGVIIKRQGNTYDVLTTKQVADNSGKYAIVTPDGRRYQPDYGSVRKLPSLDLASVQFTSNQDYRVADIGDSNTATTGAAVYVAGFRAPGTSGGGKYEFTEGRISDRPATYAANGYGLYYSNVTRSGMNGGPVLDSDGRLIGIHRQAQTDDIGAKVVLNQAIPISSYLTQRNPVSTRNRVSGTETAQVIESPRSIVPRPLFSTARVSNAQLEPRRFSALFSQRPSGLVIDESKQLVDDVWQIINRQYVDGTFNNVDWQQVRREYVNRNYSSKEDAYKAIREMLKKLNDPYTRFLDPKGYRDLRSDTSGQLTGVGMQLAQDEKTKKLVVIAPIEDTPASKAGILAKDVVVRIDDKSTEGMDVNQAVQLIRGQAGTLVTLTMQRGDRQLIFPLKRARIEIHPVRYNYQKNQLGGIGYIRLNQFSANSPREMRNALQDLERQHVNGYILDLRSNPGGLLYASIEIARMWLQDGTIVSTVDRQKERDRQTANHTALTNKPLVILVDGGSASASEILSGALQDNKRAVLVGAKTFGKGLVQSVQPLFDGSGMAVTIAKYYTPSGRDINHSGIKPDVVLELSKDQQLAFSRDRAKLGTLSDPQYALALETLRQRIAQR